MNKKEILDQLQLAKAKASEPKYKFVMPTIVSLEKHLSLDFKFDDQQKSLCLNMLHNIESIMYLTEKRL